MARMARLSRSPDPAAPALPRLSSPSPSSPSPSADPLAPSQWLRAFAVRRVARIYPAYLLALALVIAFVPAVRHHPSLALSLLAHITMMQGYVVPGGLAIIGAAWSLTTEVTFYAAWPFLARPLLEPLRSRGFRPWIFGISVVVGAWLTRAVLHEVALLPLAPAWLLEASQRRFAVSRVDQFVLGALAAVVHHPLSTKPAATSKLARRFAPWVFMLALLALPPAFYLEGNFYGRPGGSWPYALLSLATAVLVGAATLCGETASRWLFPRPLRALGLVSYGVFLNHQLLLGGTAHLAGRPGTWSALFLHGGLGLVASVIVGTLSWIWIERPLLVRLSRRPGSLPPQ